MQFGNTKIGGMSFGSTKIGGAKYGNTLVFQPGEPPTPVDPSDISNYVQDGLVSHLDGIDKGETSSRWTSLVGSEYYTLTSHSTKETNAVVMDGAGFIKATNSVSVDFSSGTIEVCGEMLTTPSAAVIVLYGVANKLAFCVGTDSYFFGVGPTGSLLQWSIQPVSLFTCSMNSIRCVLNGVSGGTLAANSWGTNVAYNTIGGRDGYPTSPRYANVRIYSIRKYNRQLTQAEILKNQRTDNARFNLGLNI